MFLLCFDQHNFSIGQFLSHFRTHQESPFNFENCNVIISATENLSRFDNFDRLSNSLVLFSFRYQCPDQCESAAPPPQTPAEPDAYGSPAAQPISSYSPAAANRRRREAEEVEIDLEDVGVEKVIQVVSSGDLTFAIKENEEEEVSFPSVKQTLTDDGYICMSTPAFAATLVILLAILVISCLLSAFLCLRHRSYYGESSLIAAFANPVFAHKKGHF